MASYEDLPSPDNNQDPFSEYRRNDDREVQWVRFYEVPDESGGDSYLRQEPSAWERPRTRQPYYNGRRDSRGLDDSYRDEEVGGGIRVRPMHSEESDAAYDNYYNDDDNLYIRAHENPEDHPHVRYIDRGGIRVIPGGRNQFYDHHNYYDEADINIKAPEEFRGRFYGRRHDVDEDGIHSRNRSYPYLKRRHDYYSTCDDGYSYSPRAYRTSRGRSLSYSTSSRPWSPSHRLHPRSSRYRPASPSTYSRLALKRRLEELDANLEALYSRISLKQQAQDQQAGRAAVERAELAAQYEEQQEKNIDLQEVLLSRFDDLERLKQNQQHASDIRCSRLANLSMDEDDARLEQGRFQDSGDGSCYREIQDPSMYDPRQELIAERLRRLDEEKRACVEEDRLAAELTKTELEQLQRTITEVEGRLAEGKAKERQCKDVRERSAVENHRRHRELQHDIEEDEERVYTTKVEIQALRREELEEETDPDDWRRPLDSAVRERPVIVDTPPSPPPYLSSQPPRYPGGNDDTSVAPDEDRWYDGDTYPLTFEDVEKAGLSVSIALKKGVSAVAPAANVEDVPLAPEASAWRIRRMNLSDGQSSTELFVVHASEYSVDEQGVGKTTLACPVGPQKQDTELAAQMRWLHVQQPSLKFKTLEQIVASCPYLPEALQSVAMENMDKAKDKFSSTTDRGSFLEPGSILRCIGTYKQSPRGNPESHETEPVLFLSSPFLNLQANTTKGAPQGEYRPQTLLQSLYGYDVDNERESQQVVQKRGASRSKKDMIHINQLWCLLIGSSILITMSDKSANELQDKSIVTDPRTADNREPLLIRLADERHRQYHAVIERDYNYADFLRYAMVLVAGHEADASDYELFDQNDLVLTPSEWIKTLGSSEAQMHTFSVKKRSGESWNRSDMGWEDYEPNYSHSRSLPTNSRRRSRPSGPLTPRHCPEYISRSRNSFDLGTRDPELMQRDYYDGRGSRGLGQDLVGRSRERYVKALPLSRGLSGVSTHRNFANSKIFPESPFSPCQLSAKKEPEEGMDITVQRPADDNSEQTDPEVLVPEDKGTSHGTGSQGAASRVPRGLSPIEELTTPSSSPKFDRLDRDAVERPPEDRASVPQEDDGGNIKGSSEAIPSSSTKETNTQNMQIALRPKTPDATLDNNLEVVDISPEEPHATISITEPWREFIQSEKEKDDGPTRRTLPAHSFRYVEPGTHRPAAERSGDGTGGGRERHTTSETNLINQPFRLNRELEQEMITDASRRDRFGEEYVSRGSPAGNGMSSILPGVVSPYLYDSRRTPGGHYIHAHPSGSIGPTNSSEVPLGNGRSRRYVGDNPYSSPPRRRLSTSSASKSQNRHNYRNSHYSAVGIHQEPKADSGPAGQINNDLSTAKNAPPDVYDLENDQSEEEGSESVVPEHDDSDGSSEFIDRTRNRRADGGPGVEIRTKADPLRPITATVIRVSDGDTVPFRRVVVRRYPQEGQALTPNVVTTEELVADIHEDGPFDDFDQRVFYRPEPKPTGDEEVSWIDELVIDVITYPRNQNTWVIEHHWPPLAASNEGLQIEHVPFLNWRLKNDQDERTPEEVDKALVSILGRVNRFLSNGIAARLYSRVFKCTMNDLLRRHDFLLATSRGDDAATEADAGLGVDDTVHGPKTISSENASGSDRHGSSTQQRQTSDGDSVNGLGENGPQGWSPAGFEPTETIHPQPESDQPGLGPAPTSNLGGAEKMQTKSVQATNHDKELMKRLFDVSKEIFCAYVPNQGSPLIHHVCVRFWGAIDDIFRQIIWDSIDSISSREDTYIIYNFDSTPAVIGEVKSAPFKRRPWSKCASCRGNKRYSAATEALEHLHEHHFNCSGKTERPHDDPCFVWLRHIRDSTSTRLPIPGIGNAGQVEEFLSRLLPISSYTKELHSLVASTQTGSSNTRPPLPAKIVHAFEQIMAMYVIQAQWLSLNNRRTSSPDNSDAIRLKTEELELQEEATKQRVYDYLQDAKKDIILLKGTSRHVDSLGVEAVGAEFLALALISNLQNRSVLAKAASTAPERADFIELYQEYSSVLRFEANRRPKKRVFLDIHGLEEELDALEHIIEAQTSVVGNYLRLIAPGSTRTTNATRVGLHKIERVYGRAQQRVLRSKREKLRVLREKSEVLKEQVKKTIEILEEDHGKAIRVFTFVTLLFLPLSFVTSFMGMNTKDLRDMEFTQNIFWMTGLPVTLVVIALALIYAYRSEEVEDWVWKQMQRRRRGSGRNRMDPGQIDGTGTDLMLLREKSGMIHVDSELVTGPGRSGQIGREHRDDNNTVTWMKDARQTLSLRRKKSSPARDTRVPRRATAGSMGV